MATTVHEHRPKTLWVNEGETDDRGITEWNAFDDEMFTHTDNDTRYEKVVGLVDTALSLLKEAGYDIEIVIRKKECCDESGSCDGEQTDELRIRY